MIDRLVTDARRHVRDTGNSEHLETHVSRDDRFRHRTHPHRIRSETSQQMNLRRRLITWTRQCTVNPATHFNTDRFRLVNYQFLQLRRVNCRHVRKTWSESFIVWTTQRTSTHQIQVIADHHQCALRQLDVNSARGVRQNQRLNAEQFESADRKRDLFKRVTFVVMHPALHRQKRHAVDFPDHETTRVTFGGRTHKPRYVFVRNRDCFLEVVSKSTETTAEYNCDARFYVCSCPDDAGCVFGAFVNTCARHSLNHFDTPDYFSF